MEEQKDTGQAVAVSLPFWKSNRWEARGNVPAITKEDMDKIKVKY